MGKTIEERFWSKVDKSPVNGCWKWTASTNNRGYGCFYIHPKQTTAHRASWIIAFGKIPSGMCILHNCDNGHLGCVNPNHLFLGTQGDNMRDMYAKNRQSIRHGEHAGRAAKLTEKQVIELRRKRLNKCRSYSSLSREYRITPSAAAMICRGRTWAYLKDFIEPAGFKPRKRLLRRNGVKFTINQEGNLVGYETEREQ